MTPGLDEPHVIPAADQVRTTRRTTDEGTTPPGPAMMAEVALAGPALGGVVGGIAWRYLPEEHRRGARGRRPASEATDVHVRIGEALEVGDGRRARGPHTRLLPLLSAPGRSASATWS